MHCGIFNAISEKALLLFTICQNNNCCRSTTLLFGLGWTIEHKHDDSHFCKVTNEIISIVSQPSKCLKFMTFREGCFVIHVEYKYLSKTLETLYHHQLHKRLNKIISVNYMIMMHHSVNNNTRMGLAIFLCSNSNHLISLISPPPPPPTAQMLDIYSVVVL